MVIVIVIVIVVVTAVVMVTLILVVAAIVIVHYSVALPFTVHPTLLIAKKTDCIDVGESGIRSVFWYGLPTAPATNLRSL